MKTHLFNAADIFVRLAPLKKWLLGGLGAFGEALETKEWVRHVGTLIAGIVLGALLF